MICTTVTFLSHDNARDAQRRLNRRLNFSTNLIHCEACDCFHLVADMSRIKIRKRPLEILKLMALGFTVREIGRDLKLHEDSVEWYIKGLRHTFHAMNSIHMVATAIAFGVISPNEFISPIIERPTSELIRRSREDVQRLEAGSGVPHDARGGAGGAAHRANGNRATA